MPDVALRREEMNRLLELAEELHDKCEIGRRRVEMWRILQLALVVALLASTYFVYTFLGENLLRIIGVWFGIVLYVILAEYIARRTLLRTKPDRRALEGVVQLIRETEAAMAQKGDWSTLEQAEFRIRLSRFQT